MMKIRLKKSMKKSVKNAKNRLTLKPIYGIIIDSPSETHNHDGVRFPHRGFTC